MRDNNQKLEEMKASGGDPSENMEPVAAAGGDAATKKRNADVKQSVDPKADEIEDTVKTPQGTNTTGIKEAFDGLFEGHDLSEEFKTKTLAVFEAAVHERVLAEKEALAEEVLALEEKFEADLAEQASIIAEEMEAKLNSYLDYVVENWMEENEVAIESAFKVEVAESLMSGIANLMSEHNLEIAESDLDAIAEKEKALEESTTKYNELFEELVAIREEKESLERDIKFAEIAEGLTDTQVDKLATLAEGVSFESVDEYAEKVSAIKDNYFKESVSKTTDETEFLEEQVEEEAAKPAIDPSVARYAESLGRLVK